MAAAEAVMGNGAGQLLKDAMTVVLTASPIIEVKPAEKGVPACSIAENGVEKKVRGCFSNEPVSKETWEVVRTWLRNARFGHFDDLDGDNYVPF